MVKVLPNGPNGAMVLGTHWCLFLWDKRSLTRDKGIDSISLDTKPTELEGPEDVPLCSCYVNGHNSPHESLQQRNEGGCGGGAKWFGDFGDPLFL